jgi:tetratricopeptide (TPR) repeat protein
MKSFFRPSSFKNSLAIIGLTSLMLTGCSETATDSSKDTDEPLKGTKVQTLPPGTWKKNFEEAGVLFQTHKYHDMVRLMEASKAQAKSEAGESLEYGKYLERLAKAHSWAIEYKPAADAAIEAVNLFGKIKAPLVDNFAANWFAGISLTELKEFDKALPYLKKAQEISHDPNAGVGESLAFLYKNLEDCYRATGDKADLTAVAKEKHARLKH